MSVSQFTPKMNNITLLQQPLYASHHALYLYIFGIPKHDAIKVMPPSPPKKKMGLLNPAIMRTFNYVMLQKQHPTHNFLIYLKQSLLIGKIPLQKELASKRFD